MSHATESTEDRNTYSAGPLVDHVDHVDRRHRLTALSATTLRCHDCRVVLDLAAVDG